MRSWFRDIIKDEELATLADRLRQNGKPNVAESRRQLFDFIRKKYAQEA